MKLFGCILTASLLFTYTLNADTLRLRDGTELKGRYIGGTQTQIWFEREGFSPGTQAVPITMVEGLKFGAEDAAPNAKLPSPAPDASFAHYFNRTLRAYFAAVLLGPLALYCLSS